MSETDELREVMREWVKETTRLSMLGFLRYMRQTGLSMSQAGALYHIGRSHEAGVADLGQHLSVSSAAASQMLDKLVQQGLVDRSVNPEDRRQKRLELTQQGKKVIRTSIDARQAWIDEVADSLTPSEREVAFHSIKLLLEKMKSVARDEDIPLSGGKGLCQR